MFRVRPHKQKRNLKQFPFGQCIACAPHSRSVNKDELQWGDKWLSRNPHGLRWGEGGVEGAGRDVEVMGDKVLRHVAMAWRTGLLVYSVVLP